jgi:hypothetical protein
MLDRYAGEGDVERLSSTRLSAHLYSLFGNVGLVLGARLLALLAAMPCIQSTYDNMVISGFIFELHTVFDRGERTRCICQNKLSGQ